MTDSSLYSHANPYFVRAVKAFGRPAEVLDVGCWDGTLGKVLIEATGSSVDGIEKERSQASKALAAGYRRVFVADLNNEVPACATYDFVLFGDVLEHLVEPEVALASISGMIKPGGRAIVSIPNVAFAGNRLGLLLGRWNYKESGILDRTHLRFFTKRTMLSLLQRAGLSPERVHGYVGLYNYPWAVREPLRWLARYWPSLFAIQIVIEARPT